MQQNASGKMLDFCPISYWCQISLDAFFFPKYSGRGILSLCNIDKVWGSVEVQCGEEGGDARSFSVQIGRAISLRSISWNGDCKRCSALSRRQLEITGLGGSRFFFLLICKLRSRHSVSSKFHKCICLSMYIMHTYVWWCCFLSWKLYCVLYCKT